MRMMWIWETIKGFRILLAGLRNGTEGNGKEWIQQSVSKNRMNRNKNEHIATTQLLNNFFFLRLTFLTTRHTLSQIFLSEFYPTYGYSICHTHTLFPKLEPPKDEDTEDIINKISIHFRATKFTALALEFETICFFSVILV
jgi:hypothetical protein